MNERERVLNKIMWRIVPLLFIGAIFAHLDRVNVGMAALQMNADVGLSPSTYGLGVGAFFIVYAVFEIPSNVWLARFGARRWLGRIMFTWGIVSISSIFISGQHSFVANRLLLGAAEAGYLPGALVYLSGWLPESHRARAYALFLMAIPLANVIGGPLATVMLGMNGWLGLRGWQWLFLLEGIPPLLLSVLMLKLLRERPAEAEWLDRNEAAIVADALAGTATHSERRIRVADMMHMILKPRILLFTAVVGCMGGINQAVTFWLPQVIKSFGVTTTQTGWAAAVPYLLGVVAIVYWARHSDRSGEKKWHLMVPAVCAGLALVCAVAIPTAVGRFACISAAMTFVFAFQAVFWSAVAAALQGAERYVGMATVSAGGLLLSFLAPYAIGLSKQATGSFNAAFLILGVMGVVGGGLALVMAGYGLKPMKASADR